MRLFIPIMIAAALWAQAGAAGATDFRSAIEAGSDGLLADLIERGADLSERDAHGWTALHLAARVGRVSQVVILLDRGAELDALAHDGITPLMMAAGQGREDVVRVLLARGARPAIVAQDGRAAADFAAEGRHFGLAAVLKRAARLAPSPTPRPHRTPVAIDAVGAWRPSIPPWSPDPLILGVPNAAGRYRVLLTRIDRAVRLPLNPTPPPYRPIERWIGEQFVFLPSDPGRRHHFPSFDTLEDISGYRFDPSHESLAGRIGVVVRVGSDKDGRYADIRLDGEPVVVRGHLRPTEEIPEIAPVLDLAVARRMYRGKTVRPRGAAVTYYRLRSDQTVRVLEVAPASSSRHPIRVLVQKASGAQETLDAGLSATNVPVIDGKRRFESLQTMFEVVAPPTPTPTASATPKPSPIAPPRP